MMMLDDVIARLERLRTEAQANDCAEHQLDAKALSAALSLLRGYRLANERTACPAREIMWVTLEQVQGLCNLLVETRHAALIVRAAVARHPGGAQIVRGCNVEQKAVDVVRALDRAEILIREVESHVGEAD